MGAGLVLNTSRQGHSCFRWVLAIRSSSNNSRPSPLIMFEARLSAVILVCLTVDVDKASWDDFRGPATPTLAGGL